MAAHSQLLLRLVTHCWWMLLFTTSCPPSTGASPSPTVDNKTFQELGSRKPQVIRAQLIHQDHPLSPLKVARGAADPYGTPGARHNARNGRSLRAGVEVSIPLNRTSSADELPSGAYVMTLYLGTPAKKFVVLMDTGSGVVWVQCLPCTSPHRCYNQTDPYFDPSASTSYSTVPCRKKKLCSLSNFASIVCDARRDCQLVNKYGNPGSFFEIGGVLSSDTLAFSNTTEGEVGISNYIFACMNNDTSTLGKIDGIAGFNRGSTSLPSQLSKLTSFNVFSYCLLPRTSTSIYSNLLFGASNSNGLELMYTPILSFPSVYTPILNNYWVNMTGISVNGIAVSIPRAPLQWNRSTLSGGTFFDSGSSNLNLSPDIFTPVVKAIKHFITYPIVVVPNTTSVCYNTSGVQQPTYPNMTLHFSGVNRSNTVDFALVGTNLFTPAVGTTLSCLALKPGPFNSIGNIAQADHYIETDVENERIGWTSRDCSLPL